MIEIIKALDKLKGTKSDTELANELGMSVDMLRSVRTGRRHIGRKKRIELIKWHPELKRAFEIDFENENNG